MKTTIYAIAVLLSGAIATPGWAFVHQDASNCISHLGYENNNNNIVFHNSCSARVSVVLRGVNDNGSDYSITCRPGRCSKTIHKSRSARVGRYCVEHFDYEYQKRDGSC